MAANLKVCGMIAMVMLGLALSSSEVEALAGATGILPAVQVWDRYFASNTCTNGQGPRVNNSRKQVGDTRRACGELAVGKRSVCVAQRLRNEVTTQTKCTARGATRPYRFQKDPNGRKDRNMENRDETLREFFDLL
jgi:hypothetical protein